MINVIKSIRLFSGFSKTAKAMCKALFVIYLLLSLFGLLLIIFIYPFEKPVPYFVGLSVGTICSAVKIALMEKSIARSLELGKGAAKNYAGLMSILRYFMTIFIFILVILFNNVFGLFGTVAGVLALQAAAYAAHFMVKHLPPSQL